MSQFFLEHKQHLFVLLKSSDVASVVQWWVNGSMVDNASPNAIAGCIAQLPILTVRATEDMTVQCAFSTPPRSSVAILRVQG